MSNQTIKVVLGSNIKREAVLINPNVSAAEPTFNSENAGAVNDTTPSNIIATGTSGLGILKKLYGR
jgi:hypothetical protein